MGGTVSVIVPVCNGAPHLEELHDRIAAVLSASCDAYEVIFVNDASTDQSWETIKHLSKRAGNVRGLDLARNVGQHGALLVGMRAALYDVVVTMDDDLQHPPEEIPGMLAVLERHPDAIVYCRNPNAPHVWWRTATSWLVYLVLRLAGAGAPPIGPFRAVRNEQVRRIAEVRGRVLPIDAYLSRAATEHVAVPARADAWRPGRSRYSMRRLSSLAMDLVVGFMPVQAMAAAAGAIWVLGSKTPTAGPGLLRRVGRVLIGGLLIVVGSRWASTRFGEPIEGDLRAAIREVLP